MSDTLASHPGKARGRRLLARLGGFAGTATAALAKRRSLRSRAQSGSADGVAAGRLLASDAARRSLGVPHKAPASTLAALTGGLADPGDRDRLAAAALRILGDGSSEAVDVVVTGSGGGMRTLRLASVRPLGGDADGGALVVIDDVTDDRARETALRTSEDRHRHIVELSPFIPWVEDAHGTILELSPRWGALTGLPVGEGPSDAWVDVVHPDDREETKQAWQAALRTGEPYDIESRLRVADGTFRWVRARASARRNEEGVILQWYGAIEDIHARKAAEIALRASESFASSILESTSDGIEVIGLDRRVEYINRPGRRLYEIEGTGYELESDWTTIWPPEFRPLAQEALERALQGRVGSFVGFCPTAKGSPKWWDVSITPIPGPDGRPARLLALSRDITAQKLAQAELERLAHHDGLTGLLSRAHFRDRLDQHLARSPSQGGLLFLDLDEFKSVNDALGHPAGDRLLRDAAARLRACVRRPDLVARLGGDEFAVLPVEAASRDEIESLAARIIGCLGEPYLLEGREVVVGVSIGIAMRDGPSATADELLKKADLALYKAKADGRGVHRVFEPGLEEAARTSQALKADLREALARGEFRLVFQPVVELGSLRVTSFEALLRWKHPGRGLLSPDAFIPLAEETGAIEEVGAWVIREASSAAASWPEAVSVSVNLSSRQFRGGTLEGIVKGALQASGLAPGRLILEITESLLLQDDEAVRRTLTGLRAKGVRVSIDDFGTGYSSLGYLRSFEVDNIKIDRSFVADLGEHPRTSAILQAVLALADQLAVSVTAEGIETETQRDRLKALGCRFGQGFLFSRPVPAGKAAWLISRGGPASEQQDAG